MSETVVFVVFQLALRIIDIANHQEEIEESSTEQTRHELLDTEDDVCKTPRITNDGEAAGGEVEGGNASGDRGKSRARLMEWCRAILTHHKTQMTWRVRVKIWAGDHASKPNEKRLF